MDGEIRHRLALAIELGADARIVGVQALDLEARIVAADEAEELSQLLRLEAVIDVGNPGDVGPELAAPANVDGGVQPEPPPVRQRIDVALERGAAGERVVLALGVIGLGRAVAVAETQRARQLGGVQPGRRDAYR
jgi:hypothetical protein